MLRKEQSSLSIGGACLGMPTAIGLLTAAHSCLYCPLSHILRAAARLSDCSAPSALASYWTSAVGLAVPLIIPRSEHSVLKYEIGSRPCIAGPSTIIIAGDGFIIDDLESPP